MSSSLWIPVFIPIALINHLWQSTLFAVAVGGLALLLRRNSARLRYTLWLIASLKFLVPFSLLAMIGTRIPWHPDTGAGAVAPRVLDLAGDFTSAPVAIDVYPQFYSGLGGASDALWMQLAALLFLVWAAGMAFLTARWLWRWLQIRRAVRKSVVVAGIDFPAPVRATEMQFEPGVVGIFRPVLLLPAGIEARLTREQMSAVLAHERCHLRWRDNLTAALHMVVETLFWFHPLVWWMGARLIAERERDCDEQVIRDGHASASYAEGILQVCEHYIASRLACVSGVSGADLRKRIESILKRTLGVKLDGPKKFILAATACCAVAAPIAAGMVSRNPIQLIFSTYAAGIYEYWNIVTVASEQWNAAVSANNYSTPTCPAPSPEIIQMQRSLAATVARLSATDGEKVLLLAVAANSTTGVQRLLAAGAARTGDGFLGTNSLMHIAARFGDVKMLETLANAGFGIDNWSGPMGIEGRRPAAETPLIVAITAGRLDNARWLIQNGADVNGDNTAGTTALSRAVALCRDQNLATQLMQAGARPDAKARRIADNVGLDVRTDASMPLPALQGWRTPPREDHAADLDGDGSMDQAALFASDDGGRLGVFVKLSSRDSDRWIKVAETDPARPPGPMHISIVKPGSSYATACAKGYGKGKGKACAAGEPTELTLKQSGIDFWAEESANSIIYWDDAVSGFKRVWISD